MNKIVLCGLMALAAVTLSGQEVLQSSDLYTTVTSMQGGDYALKIKEAGSFEKVPAAGDGTVLDPYPYGYRDFLPPSQPAGVRAVALDSTSIRVSYLASTDNIRVIGYRIYRDDAYVGYTEEESYVDSGLQQRTTYLYSVQAVDRSLNRSERSENVAASTLDPTAASSPPHFVAGPSVRYAADTFAVVGFTTDKAVEATVEYGADGSYGSSATVAEYLTEHVVTLTGLSPGTSYEYRVTVNDFGDHGPVTSAPDQFYTAWNADTVPPGFLQGPTASYVSDTLATITFQTDEDALATVWYGAGSLNEEVAAEAFYAADHSVTLTGLDPFTAYSFQVEMSDRSGNGPVASAVLSFTTTGEPDLTPPHIHKKPRPIYLADHVAVLGWETDEPANSVVNFGTARGFLDRQAVSHVMTTRHLVVLYNLDNHEKIYFSASSTDPSGNVSEEWREQHFTTFKFPDDAPPKIRKLEVRAEADWAVIRWETDELTESKVLFGTDSGVYTFQKYDWNLAEKHSMRLTGLTPGERYYFQILATDPSGNQAQTPEYSFPREGKRHQFVSHSEARDHHRKEERHDE